jgi:hypothetical protein
MANNNPENINAKKWVLEAPTPPGMVVDSLKAAKVRAYFCPKFECGKNSITSGTMEVESTFAKLPVVKQILENAGVKRERWPRPRPASLFGKPSRQKFKLTVKYDVRGPVILTYVTIRLTPQQAMNLKGYAARTGQSQQQAAQALFKHALALRSK